MGERVPTVKVYKGKDHIVVNKTDVATWNEAGYFTSSQQKENKSSDDAAKKAADDAAKKDKGVESK